MLKVIKCRDYARVTQSTTFGFVCSSLKNMSLHIMGSDLVSVCVNSAKRKLFA